MRRQERHGTICAILPEHQWWRMGLTCRTWRGKGGSNRMSDVTLRVRADAPIGTISPRLYGHFAEHLGRCCYDGLFVGAENADVPHVDGFRMDVIEALRAMPVPLLRWPGGCYADHYHWGDGIGPA